LITAGRVEIDGQVVTDLGTKVDPSEQEIRVDGTRLAKPTRIYFAINKPPGAVSTSRDPSGRPRVIDFVPEKFGRLFTVGRLDLNSEGLILVTNDGELANRLTHPRYGVEKTYRVLVAGDPTLEDLDRLRQGVRLAEGVARIKSGKILRRNIGRHKQAALLELVLAEGRNREIRRILARVGHKVLRLTRTAIGPLRLGKLAPGEYRRLSHAEVEALRAATRKRKSEM
jgi:23S rRNA pseudouridine2605 synthase